MNKIFLSFAVILAAAFFTTGFSARAEASGKILVAYFSYQGHTANVAREIAAQTGGDLFEIKPAMPYPGYDECLDVAKAEKNNNARPSIDGRVENMADYDVVFVGYPIWWYDAPMIVLSFLESYDFSGKTVIPLPPAAAARSRTVSTASAPRRRERPSATAYWPTTPATSRRGFPASATQNKGNLHFP